MTSHANFRDDSITVKADNDITHKIDGHDHSTNLQRTLHGTHAVPHLHSKLFSGAAQPFKMQRNTEREYNC